MKRSVLFLLLLLLGALFLWVADGEREPDPASAPPSPPVSRTPDRPPALAERATETADPIVERETLEPEQAPLSQVIVQVEAVPGTPYPARTVVSLSGTGEDGSKVQVHRETDDRGVATFSGLAPGSATEVEVHARRWNHSATVSGTVPLPGKAPWTLRVPLLERELMVVGRLVETTGAPIEMAFVKMRCRDSLPRKYPQLVPNFTTDEQGRFHFPIHTAKTTPVLASLAMTPFSDRLLESRPRYASLRVDGPLKEEMRHVGDIVVQEVIPRFRGRVADLDGNPLEEVEIWPSRERLVLQDDRELLSVTTDTDGDFEVGVPNGYEASFLRFWRRGFQPHWVSTESMEADSTIVLEPAWEASGKVLLPEGFPTSEIEVRVTNLEEPSLKTSLTLTLGGHYSVGSLGAEQYLVEVRCTRWDEVLLAREFRRKDPREVKLDWGHLDARGGIRELDLRAFDADGKRIYRIFLQDPITTKPIPTTQKGRRFFLSPNLDKVQVHAIGKMAVLLDVADGEHEVTLEEGRMVRLSCSAEEPHDRRQERRWGILRPAGHSHGPSYRFTIREGIGEVGIPEAGHYEVALFLEYLLEDSMELVEVPVAEQRFLGSTFHLDPEDREPFPLPVQEEDWRLAIQEATSTVPR